MPYVRVFRPRRSYPRQVGPEAVARMYCKLVERGIPDEIIDGYIDFECGEERKKKSQAAQAQAEASAGLIEGETTSEDVQRSLIRRMAAQLVDNNEYLNTQITIIKRQDLLLKILAPALGLLRRFPLTAPAATLVRSLQKSNAATLRRIEPLKAANDELFGAARNFFSRDELVAILREAA